MVIVIVEYMVNYGVKIVVLIGFVDVYGDFWVQEFDKVVGLCKLKVVVNECFVCIDMLVMGQVLKIMLVNLDVVLIVGLGMLVVLLEWVFKECGYKGKLYQMYGVVNVDFLCVCGKDCDGMFLLVGLILVVE